MYEPAIAAFAAYLVGSVPFGYLIARAKGVDLFRAGSGNIGATNVGRVLGRKFGVLVFLLDFLKGALPVAAARLLSDDSLTAVAAAAAAFLGHLFPVFLGFRGGKGVATGAGAVAVLVPGPAVAAVAAWAIVVLCSRVVSLGSVVAVFALVLVRFLGTPGPLDPENVAVTVFCVVGTLLVVVKHQANLARLRAGTESQIGEFSMRVPLLKSLHVAALGLWVGGAAFFNFVAAPAIFASFKEVVDSPPGDRTAGVALLPDGAPAETKAALASALAGAAVGPVFPRYYTWQLVCGAVAVVTAMGLVRVDRVAKVHRWRVRLCVAAYVCVLIGLPVSNEVSRVRVERFSPDATVAADAKAAFGPIHLVSLGLSAVSVLLAGGALLLAGSMPVVVSVEKTGRG